MIYTIKKHNMQIRYVDPVVKMLSRKIGKLISDKELKSLQRKILGSEFDIKKFYKLVFVLKQRQFLVPLRKDLYIVSYPENDEFTVTGMIEKLYRELLQKQIQKHCGSDYYIGSTKWLELSLWNYEIPNEIEVYNTRFSGVEPIFSDYRIYFKKYPLPKGTFYTKVKSCFRVAKKHRQKISIGGYDFSVGPVEVCALESLYYSGAATSTYQSELIKRVIKKYQNIRSRDIVKQVIKSGKHHTSLNKLHDIAKWVGDNFTETCNTIINTFGFKIRF